MLFRRSIPAALLALAVAAPALAQPSKIDPEKEYSPAYDRCLNTGDALKGVTAAMAGCTNAELQKQDARLNRAYKAEMAGRSKARQAGLRNAQRAWIKRRDAECRENLTGGTIDILEIGGCHLSMTTVRAVELERMAKR
ncbi:MAG: lysozyme inhibitor LprI family protein [Caulobacter sp.]